MDRYGIIGFGEVGGIFARDLAAAGAHVAAYDVAPAAQARAEAAGCAAPNAYDAARGAGVVLVCVTSGSALDERHAPANLAQGRTGLAILGAV